MVIKSSSFQYDLFDKSFEDVAISIIQQYEPPGGYYLAFSGGKDSVVIYDLAQRAGVKFTSYFSMTTVDPPEVHAFIREHYPDVIWKKPKNGMFQLIRKKSMLPTRVIRFCCYYMKEIGGSGQTVLLGVRKSESLNRRNRSIYEESRRTKGKWFVNPILDWTDDDVWTYIRKRKLPYCSLYDEGWKRLGCIMCPLQSKEGMLRDAKRWPKYYKAYVRAVNDVIKSGKRWTGMTGEEVIHWWINGRYD